MLYLYPTKISECAYDANNDFFISGMSLSTCKNLSYGISGHCIS